MSSKFDRVSADSGKEKKSTAIKSSKSTSGFIDLGDKMLGTSVPSKKSKPEKYYPSIYLNSGEINGEVGKVGKAVVQYKIKSKTIRDNGDGKKTDMTLDMMKFKEIK